MCPNVVQYALVAADLASAQLCKHDTSCVRQPRQALGIIHDTLLDAMISIHLEHARDAIANGDREIFERRCERAGRIARWYAPARLADVEQVVETGSSQQL